MYPGDTTILLQFERMYFFFLFRLADLYPLICFLVLEMKIESPK